MRKAAAAGSRARRRLTRRRRLVLKGGEGVPLMCFTHGASFQMKKVESSNTCLVLREVPAVVDGGGDAPCAVEAICKEHFEVGRGRAAAEVWRALRAALTRRRLHAAAPVGPGRGRGRVPRVPGAPPGVSTRRPSLWWKKIVQVSKK